MKKEKTTITLSELAKEIDKYRVDNFRKIEMTEEQRKFIRMCRGVKGKKNVTYKVMTELWKKLGWGELKMTSIVTRCNLVLSSEKQE